jgi:hypothetical protein
MLRYQKIEKYKKARSGRGKKERRKRARVGEAAAENIQ